MRYSLETFQSVYALYSPTTLQEHDNELYQKIADIKKLVAASASCMIRRVPSRGGRGDGYRQYGKGGGGGSRGYGKSSVNKVVRTRPQLACKTEDDKTHELNITLNKITEKTYEKLWMKILEILNSGENYVDYVLERIFVLVSLNKSLVSIYTKMYGNLYETYKDKCDALFCVKIEEYANTVNEIVPLNPQTDYDNYCIQCKKNDQRRSLSHFFCELNRERTITTENFYRLIDRMYRLFIECVMGENMGERVNEAIDNLQILILNTDENISGRIPLIWDLATSEDARSRYPSSTNKSIFKCRDIVEGLK